MGQYRSRPALDQERPADIASLSFASRIHRKVKKRPRPDFVPEPDLDLEQQNPAHSPNSKLSVSAQIDSKAPMPQANMSEQNQAGVAPRSTAPLSLSDSATKPACSTDAQQSAKVGAPAAPRMYTFGTQKVPITIVNLDNEPKNVDRFTHFGPKEYILGSRKVPIAIDMTEAPAVFDAIPSITKPLTLNTASSKTSKIYVRPATRVKVRLPPRAARGQPSKFSPSSHPEMAVRTTPPEILTTAPSNALTQAATMESGTKCDLQQRSKNGQEASPSVDSPTVPHIPGAFPLHDETKNLDAACAPEPSRRADFTQIDHQHPVHNPWPRKPDDRDPQDGVRGRVDNPYPSGDPPRQQNQQVYTHNLFGPLASSQNDSNESVVSSGNNLQEEWWRIYQNTPDTVRQTTPGSSSSDIDPTVKVRVDSGLGELEPCQVQNTSLENNASIEQVNPSYTGLYDIHKCVDKGGTATHTIDKNRPSQPLLTSDKAAREALKAQLVALGNSQTLESTATSPGNSKHSLQFKPCKISSEAAEQALKDQLLAQKVSQELQDKEKQAQSEQEEKDRIFAFKIQEA